jgi:signal peptidase
MTRLQRDHQRDQGPHRGHNLVRRTAALLGSVVLLGVLLASLAVLVPGLLGMQRYVITTGSMTGTYDVGSLVFDRAVPARDLHVGDVVTYLPPVTSGVDHLVTHRLVSIRTHGGHTTYRTKGDANPAPDPWTFELTGTTQPRVVFSLPYVGRLFIALADPTVRMFAIVVPAVVIAIRALVELLAALRTRRTDTERPSEA